MYIHELSKLSGTTKKAIEYYCQKGLLNPGLSENGYRVFSHEDVSQLKKISLLRNLGISVEDIRQLLTEYDDTIFQRLIAEREHHLRKMKAHNELLKELSVTKDWQAIYQKASLLEAKESITDRLISAFPGFYGKYLALHFGRFLQEPAQTDEQKKAYQEICEYLDGIHFDIPEELKSYLNEIDTEAVDEILTKTNEALSELTKDPESYLQKNKEVIEQYLAYKQSEEYQSSPACRLMDLLRKFQQEQGYNDIFIPAMQRLSPAYKTYLQNLKQADLFYIKQYPSSASQ